MKKVVTVICSLLLVAGAYAFEVNEKVLKSFKETFTAAEEVKWEEYKTYYTVSFVNTGIRSKVNYDKDGIMLGSIRYYAPQMLPLNIYNRLKKEHGSKEMFGVTEVTFGTDITYFVKMQNAKNWITVKIDATGNSSIHEKYKKG
ncbi:MAG: hypothetical protein H7122_01960 [Chitinophagaceae bacterium]|nr:hypothetical protein [Chitinophagaceae bacterium]